MSYSPAQWEEIKKETARMLADDAKAEAGGIKELVFLTLEEVSVLSKLSRSTIPKRMPVRKEGGKHLVKLSDYIAWAEKNPKASMP